MKKRSPLTEKQKQLSSALKVARIEEFVSGYTSGLVGAPEADRRAIARAFVAKSVYNMDAASYLRERLECQNVEAHLWL